MRAMSPRLSGERNRGANAAHCGSAFVMFCAFALHLHHSEMLCSMWFCLSASVSITQTVAVRVPVSHLLIFAAGI